MGKLITVEGKVQVGKCKEINELLLDRQTIEIHEQEVIASILCEEEGRE